MKVLACTVVALGAISMAQAQVSPAGTWTWTNAPGRGGGGGRGGRGMGAGTNTLVLKLDADGKKVTGTLQGPPRGGRRMGNPDDATPPPAPTPSPAVPIANGSWASPTLTFDVVQAGRGGGEDTTIKYKGTVTADKITGTITRPPRGGEGDPIVTDWTATKTP